MQYGYQLEDDPYQHADMPMAHDGRYTPADSIEMHQAVGDASQRTPMTLGSFVALLTILIALHRAHGHTL